MELSKKQIEFIQNPKDFYKKDRNSAYQYKHKIQKKIKDSITVLEEIMLSNARFLFDIDFKIKNSAILSLLQLNDEESMKALSNTVLYLNSRLSKKKK